MVELKLTNHINHLILSVHENDEGELWIQEYIDLGDDMITLFLGVV
jgi:hypothetical protein